MPILGASKGASALPFRRGRSTVAPWLVLAVCLATAAMAAGEASRYEVEGRRSGYLYLGDQTRQLQDDEFLNPGMFAVEQGRELWARVDGAAGKSCASCHDEASMRGVAARYPRHDARRGGLVNLELVINDMRAEHMGAPAYGYESEEMLALSTYIAHQSRGLPMQVEVDGPARPFFEEGRAFFLKRRGQLNLSCAQCHDDLAGQKLRGDTISQGQVNGFPIYRLMWRSVASRHRMFEWCNTALRAEPYALGSPEYLALELYVAWRGRGLPIESPAVRR
jgi:sulfur-oxidizing protein SoxA